jgi:outer membrane protein assembly factor BamA
MTAAVQPRRWLAFGGALDYLTPRIDSVADAGRIGTLFDDVTAPGLRLQPDFVRYEAFGELNYREPRGNPRRGGRYALTAQQFVDLDDDRYTFHRVEADLQQYVPLLRDRRVLALHGLVSISDADDGRDIPFYLQRTLGGPDDLRGFRRFRFRDRHLLLLQAEYRWEIFTAVDGAIFYDAGKVASRVEDLDFRDLESDYGIGFRFGSDTGVFLRVEGAFGSSGGKHFIFRFGHVF